MRCEIWPWHNPPTPSFSRCKQSRSGESSTQKTGIDKVRVSERFSHQRRRASHFSWRFRVVICSRNPRYVCQTNLLELSSLIQTDTLSQSSPKFSFSKCSRAQNRFLFQNSTKFSSSKFRNEIRLTKEVVNNFDLFFPWPLPLPPP